MKFSVLMLLACFSLSGLSPIFTKGIDLVALKKQEEERRKKISKSKQAITDANVNMIVSGGKSYGFVQMESEGSPAAETISEVSNTENQTNEEKQPDFWKKQQIELETRITQLKETINNEQSELNKLWSDFYIKNVAAEQNAINMQINQLTNQIEQKKLSLSQTETELEDLFEKARKAGIPPGWLR
jgi:flagellar biosynthesis chaperone FliJ